MTMQSLGRQYVRYFNYGVMLDDIREAANKGLALRPKRFNDDIGVNLGSNNHDNFCHNVMVRW